MDASPLPGPRGRGASGNPENRFTRLSIESEEPPPDKVATIFYTDTTRAILARNDSPDVGFSVSVNPYRGCEHGCIYCFARPTHEYLGLSAGLDFETRIFVKEDAPELLRRELGKRGYVPEVIAMSGVTDPYQPVERRLEITRRCLEVLAEFRNPVAIITKNALVARDVDHLASLAEHRAALVCMSITTLDPDVARTMEPRASHPRDRLEAVAKLAAAGVPCAVLAAPMVPGLTDHELPAILAAAAAAGAKSAHFIPLRLPGAVAGLFEQWLHGALPRPQGQGLEPHPRHARRAPQRPPFRQPDEGRRDLRRADAGPLPDHLPPPRPLRPQLRALDRRLQAAGSGRRPARAVRGLN